MSLSLSLSLFCLAFLRLVLTMAIEFAPMEVVKRLIDDNYCDINFMPNDDKIKYWHSPITICSAVKKGFDSKRPTSCDNYKIFEILISNDSLDLEVENQNGDNAIMLLQKNKTKHYLEILKEKAKSNKYAWSKKYTFEKIVREIRTNEIATTLTAAAGMKCLGGY